MTMDGPPDLGPAAGAWPGAASLAERLNSMEQRLEEIQALLWALLPLAARSPVHLDVERLEVERLDFRVENIGVEELSGEMNIGLTSMFKVGQGATAPIQPDQEPPLPPPAPALPQPEQLREPEPLTEQRLWPPTHSNEEQTSGGE